MLKYWQLKLLFLMFIAPVLIAGYLLLVRDPQSFKTTQHGIWVNPPQRLAMFAPNNKWQIIRISPTVCDLACQNKQQALANLHTALGVDRERVVVENIHNERIQDLKDDSILILDPKGFYIMHYAPGTKLDYVLSDIKLLLKYSHAN